MITLYSKNGNLMPITGAVIELYYNDARLSLAHCCGRL